MGFGDRLLRLTADMDSDDIRQLLDPAAPAPRVLTVWGLADVERGLANLRSIVSSGITLDLVEVICRQLAVELPLTADPGMALNNLDRFVAAARNPLSLGALFERDEQALGILLQIFSTSQYLSDQLVRDSESYDLLRITEGQPVARQVLVDEISAEVESLEDERAVMGALRRFKRRETLRVAYGDIVRGQRLDVVTAQISHLADAILEAALAFAMRRHVEKRGQPRRPDGQPARFVALGMGKLGGSELNYSSDIDLIFLAETAGHTDGARRMTNQEFFDRMARDVVRLLTEATPDGSAYRVDLRLRPEGERGPLVTGFDAACNYYDVLGRTWERQAFVKARAVAGDLDLGRGFLARLEPWIYQRYLTLADITGIKALKRRIEQRTVREGAESLDVKTGHGGIRDIEFVIQFLQLLNGGDLPEVRTANTLLGIADLEHVGCLTPTERSLLEENYAFLRKIEHRLQIMFDLQTHRLPSGEEELAKLAVRMGYNQRQRGGALAAFLSDYQTRTELNRKILDHLLHEAFPDDAATEPEVDLVLDPDPAPAQVAEVLGRFPLADIPAAYRNLTNLATERIAFLSTRRCRHFLASIAPRLLAAVAATPDPDSTLVNLVQVSDSLGGKGVLWELFNCDPPSLRLYVDLCAYSPFLSGILISNPGMIDELMDSLVLNKLPTLEDLSQTLTELCSGAEDIDPILHTFKNAQQLRVGVHDLLGKADIQATTAALSNIAQAALAQIARAEYAALSEKLGQPIVASGPRAGQPAELVILALGKFGGAELNYHSDLDLVFLYETEGHTLAPRRGRRGEPTTNQHFFSELGQRITKTASQLGPYGRLYEIDPRLRPTGRSGALSTSFTEFVRYFTEGQGALWERMALCRARVVVGSDEVTQAAKQAIEASTFARGWQAGDSQAIRDMRQRLEDSASPGNLKRGAGGIVDIEFLVQMLVLRFGTPENGLRQPNTLTALDALRDAKRLTAADHRELQENYRFLRTLESRLRLINDTARDDLPDEPAELAKLARLLGGDSPQAVLERCHATRLRNRQVFTRHFDA